METHVLGSQESGFHWLDVVAPTREGLQNLAIKYRLHPAAIQDCLDPVHLPKYECFGDTHFLILRAFDEQSPPDVDSIRELTWKIGIFVNEKFVITVHRKDGTFVRSLQEKWKSRITDPESRFGITLDLLGSAGTSFRAPVEKYLDTLDQFEESLFKPIPDPTLEEGYYLKRRALVIKRVLRAQLDLLPKLPAFPPVYASEVQDARETIEHLYIAAEEVVDNVGSLLNLQLALASHRTNEIIRILTLFSAFFLPLTFIVGVYGMNFEHMPELKLKYGYPVTLSLMAAVAFAIYFWFRRNRWID